MHAISMFLKLRKEYICDNMSQKIAFPTAAVVREMKKKIPEKMISQKVKAAMNQFVSDLAEIVARDMSKKSDSVLYDYAFEYASKPYLCAANLCEEQDKVVHELEKIRSKLDNLVQDFRGKFEIPDNDGFKVGNQEMIRALE